MNQIDNQFSKEAIRNRLMRTAANLWGVKNPMSLDPFVRLLMETFSIEISRAANETQNTQARILDKLARLLTPSLLTMPYTAHAIMQVTPAEPTAVLSSLSTFKHSKRVATKPDGPQDGQLDIVFMPIDSVPLFKGRVAYMASGKRLYQYDGLTGFKEPLLLANEPLPWATCYIGLAMNEEIRQLQGMPVYFDFSSFRTLPWLYQLLSLCKIKIEGNAVEVEPGFRYIKKEYESLEEEIFQHYDVMRKMTDEIKTVYNPKFITVKSDCILPENKTIPPALLKHFSSEEITQLREQNITWMEITFPANYTYEMLEDMYVSINAFPVMNRFMKKTSASSSSDIIPLRIAEKDERFLAIHKAEDALGRSYTEIPYNRSESEAGGYYSLRYGGVEKFDERSALDMLNYLIELSRDEVSAFSSLDDSFSKEMTDMSDNHLRPLHDKVHRAEKHTKQPSAYMVVEPYDKSGEIVHIDYWVTQTYAANNLRIGTLFTSDANFGIEKGNAILLTETAGGRDQTKSSERLDAYRYALCSRDRLVTQEDISNFCRYLMPEKIKEVEFELGLAISPHPKQGYIRTVDIRIIPYQYGELKKEEWDELAQQMLFKIKAKSPCGTNYRVIFENCEV